MLHTRKSFTVPASAGSKATCEKDGHAWADTKGRCIRCGTQIRDTGFNVSEGEDA